MKMKKMVLILLVLVTVSLACASFGGGNNEGNNNDENANLNQDDNDNTPPDNHLNNGVDENTEDNAEEDDTEDEDIVVPPAFNACYNSFYPIVDGRVWTYSASFPGEEPTQYTITTTDFTEDTITAKMQFPEFSSEVLWHCGEDGLFSSEYAQFNLQELGNAEIETINYEGNTLPADKYWKPGYTWEMSYEINMTVEVEGIVTTAHVVTTMTNEIMEKEEVTVPAGTYNAFRVETIGTISMTTSVGEASFTTDVPLEYTNWYVKDVGMIKSVSTDTFTGTATTSTTELISIEE